MRAFRELDRVLRGEATSPDALAGEGLGLSAKPLVQVGLMLAAGYGVCMGVYGMLRPDGAEWRLMAAGAVKVPSLLFLTVLVTFPSLYVFNTLLGSRLRFTELLRLVVYALSVMIAVLAAFGPIVAFFSVSTTSYPFVLLLNVAVFAVAGAFGVGFLHTTLVRLLRVRSTPPPPPPVQPSEGEPPRPVAQPVRADQRPKVSTVFYVWMVMFGVVGAQMGWVLRPFVGSPHLPFAWLRPREASFFEAVAQSLRALLGG
jgi:hypothetical protein